MPAGLRGWSGPAGGNRGVNDRAMTTSQVTILDGAMGTALKARGATVPDYRSSAWSAVALVSDPGAVKQVHRDYIDVGTQVGTANNYAVVVATRVAAGATLVGGRCDTNPAHIAALARRWPREPQAVSP